MTTMVAVKIICGLVVVTWSLRRSLKNHDRVLNDCAYWEGRQ
jgi:hypothetical protein